MTAEEIKALALRMFRREVFTSLQVKEKDIHLLRIIFMPLFIMGDEARQALAKKKIGMFYSEIAKAGPRSINGYPIFQECTFVSQASTKKVLAKLREIQEAVERI